jgi:hypothetical protein
MPSLSLYWISMSPIVLPRGTACSKFLVAADALNARLSSTLAISTDEGRSKSWIWNEIEWVVELRSERRGRGRSEWKREWRSLVLRGL